MSISKTATSQACRISLKDLRHFFIGIACDSDSEYPELLAWVKSNPDGYPELQKAVGRYVSACDKQNHARQRMLYWIGQYNWHGRKNKKAQIAHRKAQYWQRRSK